MGHQPNLTDATVIASTRVLVEAMERQLGIPYGLDRWAPVGDHHIEHAALRMNTLLAEMDLPDGVYEIATPGYFGHAVIGVRKGLPSGERRFAIRHGMAHLLGGELDECESGQVRFMSSVFDIESLEERRADLFALADLVPDWWIAEAPSHSRADLEEAVRERIRTLLPSWPEHRVKSRARLRVNLYGMPSEAL